MATILEAQALTKCFRHPWTLRQICVLEDLELRIEEGEVFGLIGPNGAGKTTTFKLIMGLLRPTRGAVTFAGSALSSASRAAIGFLPEQPYFYDHLTVEETLDFYARLCGLHGATRRQRVADLLEEVHLVPKRRATLRTLSKGNLQRVGVAQAIINRPRLVILDEPMSGLDPLGRHSIRELILSLRRQGTTVLFSSHILPDAEALCDRVGLLVQGRLREVIHMRRDAGPVAYQLSFSVNDPGTLAALERITGHAPTADGHLWTVRLSGPSEVRTALDAVRDSNGAVERLTPVYPSLEERFLAHVGHLGNLD